MIGGANMVFITAGMGGGTGTGAAPVVAQIAKEMGILTVAVVTKPFAHEGKRMRLAQTGIEALTEHVDSLIIVPNEKLMTVLGEDTTLLDAFRSSNSVLQGAVAGIAEVINVPGTGERGLCRRAHADVGKRHGDDGFGFRFRTGSRQDRRRERHVQPAAGRRGSGRCTRRAGEHQFQLQPHAERIPGSHQQRTVRH